jgi:hypothetical protein
MVSGSYALSVRCEHKADGCTTPPATFSGIHERAARQAAREKGWFFHHNDVSCPECVRRKMADRQWRS